MSTSRGYKSFFTYKDGTSIYPASLSNIVEKVTQKIFKYMDTDTYILHLHKICIFKTLWAVSQLAENVCFRNMNNFLHFSSLSRRGEGKEASALLILNAKCRSLAVAVGFCSNWFDRTSKHKLCFKNPHLFPRMLIVSWKWKPTCPACIS